MSDLEQMELMIEKKVKEEVRVATNKWSEMGVKQKLDLIFVVTGILSFTSMVYVNWKKIKKM